MTAADLAQLPEDQVTWQLMAAMEAADHEYERWARMLVLDINAATDRMYRLVHDAYAALWLAMGDAFHDRLWPLAESWRARARAARG